MKKEEFINEHKKGRRAKKHNIKPKKYIEPKKPKKPVSGPGPGGSYGVDAGYSGVEERRFTDYEKAIMEGGGSIESNEVYYLKKNLEKKLYERYQGQGPDLPDLLEKFLPFAMKELNLSKLPKIKLEKQVMDFEQPTFGRFINDANVIQLGLKNRHPLDILRTLAHELVHFKQNLENRLDAHSGDTGSPEENEAHIRAGIIMRNFNKRYPHYFSLSALV